MVLTHYQIEGEISLQSELKLMFVHHEPGNEINHQLTEVKLLPSKAKAECLQIMK